MGATSWGGAPDPSPEEMMSKFMIGVIVIIFLIILYVLMVHLFARWVVGGFEVQSLGRSRRRLDFAPPEPAHSGLEASVIHALPLVIFKQENFQEGLECAVCLCELEDGETARLLPNCNHGFHVECIDMWFLSHATCPLCRITVEPDYGESSPETLSEEADSDSDSSVRAGSNGQDAQATSLCPQSPCSSTSATPNSSRQSSLIIDIPTKLTNGFTEEEMESPMDRMSARFRSLTRLLSRGKTEIASSPNSVDVEQGEGGKGQS